VLITAGIVVKVQQQYHSLLESSTQLNKEISQKMELLSALSYNSSTIYTHLLQFRLDSTLEKKIAHKLLIDSMSRLN
jgi:hypothetical protein